MASNTRAVELQREIDNLKEQLQNSVEGTNRNVKEIQEQQARSMEEMRDMFLALTAKEGSQGHRNQSGDGGEPSHQRRTNTHQFSRVQRIEFPRFAGDDFKGWLFRCEQFFDVDETPEEDKIKIASVHLEGRALQWHQTYLKERFTRELPRWEEYIQVMSNRFGTALYDDPMAELMNLRQVGSVQSYLDSFDELLNRVELSEQHMVSCFLSGLKDEIEVPVRMFMPKTLHQAVSLAKLQERSLNLFAKRNFTHAKPPPLLPKPNLSNFPMNSEPYSPKSQYIPKPNNDVQLPSTPSKVITTTEMDEKRAKGLCYWCDSKYTVGHKCRGRRQLFVLKVGDESDDEEEMDSMEGGETGKITDNVGSHPQISANAMSGVHDYNTMRVAGSVNGKAVHILIDTGSTHNFVDTRSAKRLGCAMDTIPPFSVTVADGNKICSSYMCRGLSWRLQGVTFTDDVLAIPLGGCDLVLGAQWLVELGDINWNFKQLKMEFNVDGKKVSLRGKQSSLPKVIDHEKMNKIFQKTGQIASIQLGLFQENEEVKRELNCLVKKGGGRHSEKEMQQQLEEFRWPFGELKRQEGQWVSADFVILVAEPNSFQHRIKVYYYITLRERHHTYEYHVFKGFFHLRQRQQNFFFHA